MLKRKICVFFYLCFISISFGTFGACSTHPDDITDDLTYTASSFEDIASGEKDTSETAESQSTPDNQEIKAGIMGIYVFDIGKADAILITTENFTVMIDAGENKHGDEIADFLFENNITEIDYLIITHFDKDHVGGADTIIKEFAIKKIIVPDYSKESKQYNQFVEAADQAGLEQNILTEVVEFTLDDAVFTLYPPQHPYHESAGTVSEESEDDNATEEIEENDLSIVVSVSHGNNNFLFAGDAMAERLGELLLLEEVTGTKYDFLKVPHHGRYNKRSIEFINTIRPLFAVITCSGNSFEPADERVIAALEAVGAEVYFTPNGDVYCESNGNEFIVSYK